jgi:hypothetical protein
MASAIDKFQYQFWIVKKLETIDCICRDAVSKEPKPNCKFCLGLGKRIKIFKVNGASREAKELEALRGDSISVTPKMFYLKGKFNLSKGDMIIDDENIFAIYAVQYHRGIKGEPNHTKCVCPPLKMNHKETLKTFKELLNEYKLRKK